MSLRSKKYRYLIVRLSIWFKKFRGDLKLRIVPLTQVQITKI